MSKWEDAVMTHAEVQALALESVDHSGYDPKLLEFQARIAFKAGQMSVVEWLEEKNLTTSGLIVHIKLFDWQARLKDWRIDNEG